MDHFCEDCGNPTGRGYRAKTCELCRKNRLKKVYRKYRRDHWARAKKYGINQTDFNEMLKAQNNLCLICSRNMNQVSSKGPCIDHDHKTGKVRGLLCLVCNAGIGKLQDDPVLCERAALYLRAYAALL